MAGGETIKRIARGKPTIHTGLPSSTNPPPPAPASPSDAKLARFWRTAMDCRECPALAPWRKFPPAARGNPRLRIMILGEAPGRVSLDNGRPFSNPRNLMVRNAVALAIAPSLLRPEEILYFSDAVKCWPASKTGANRSPTTKETATCTALHLLRELEIIRPRVIFAFGARATSALLGNSVKLSQAHGSVCHSSDGARVIPLMHPSTINIAGMRRVGIKSLGDYERQLAVLFRREFALLPGLVDHPDETKQS
jgi:uracil-DNA glycosylase